MNAALREGFNGCRIEVLKFIEGGTILIRKRIQALTLLFALFFSACASAPPALTIDALKNSEYRSEFPASKKAKLTHGSYQEDIVPGSASKLTITLLEQHAIGDLNGDGVPDAAVILATNSGGSGVFVDLAAVVNDKGIPKHIASAALGDRVQIKSVSISAGEIGVSLVKQGPNDPLCCPSQAATLKFKLQGDKLLPVN